MLKVESKTILEAAIESRPVTTQVRTRPAQTAEVAGVAISLLNMPRMLATLASWITLKQTRQISTADVHAVMRARFDTALMQSFEAADVVVADGAPVALAASLQSGQIGARVPGPDLMLEACRQGVVLGWRHYFYGGNEGVAADLAAKLQARFPGLIVVGTECPPFRSLTASEKQATADQINASGADIVWVGLGCPKQDIWMRDMRPLLTGSVLVGVGAAFDFHSGRVVRAPAFMRRNGLEWIHRLASEPRRLWRRYLVLAPQFIVLGLLPAIVTSLHRTVSNAGVAR
jgi:N-acetylglucosaminyldiphosphoundecaprenol N-acetyl-beta-D-mannosaminyltransferase